MIARRARSVHLRDELAKRCLLSRAALKDELHAVKLHAVWRRAAVVCGVGQRTHGVGERNALAFDDGVDDTNGWADTLCLGGDGAEKDTGQHAQGERARMVHMGRSWTLS